jgi:heterodisulfide reductase subunit A
MSYAIAPDVCTRCGVCVEACPQGAINLEAPSTGSQIEVDAVVLSPGFSAFDASRAIESGWGRCANVLTSLEFEQLLSRSGPTGGRPLRPSDGQAPHRIAFVQCVGSRSERLGRPYCASLCCMITAKQVNLAKQVAPELDVTVYSMDVRAAGKGYERYVAQVQALPGVTYRWGRPAAVHEIPGTQDLRLLTPEGEETFDMVVLAVGMGPDGNPDSGGVRELAAAAQVALDEYGFVRSGNEGPGSTSRQGVFAAGFALAPADVPRTVTQAAAVAAMAAQGLPIDLPPSPPPSLSRREEPEELFDRPPRVGLFVCACRGALGDALNLAALATAGRRLRAVAHVERLEAACETSGLSAIEQAVSEHDLNRIVVAGCSPRLYATRFDALMDRLALPSRLLARVSIREGAAWAHAGDPGAMAAAESALRMAVASLRDAAFGPFHAHVQENAVGRVLILGGGLAGMEAALTLDALGVECDLIEREARLGGNLRERSYTLDGIDTQALRTQTAARVRDAARVRICTEAELIDWSGVRGDFWGIIQRSDRSCCQERYGALIIATGAHPATTGEYLYRAHEGVVTQRELASRIETLDPAKLRSVVMIQCVGSRDDDHPYCSRVCCAQAIANALALKTLDPGIEVSVLFRDLRTMGVHELYYQQARRLGVRFLRYEPPERPLAKAAGNRLSVTVHDTLYDEVVTLDADLLVLSTGIVASQADNERLAQLLGTSLDEDGFYREAHPKLRPTDLAQPGIFLCGLAYAPCTIEESITQARAAAMRAALTVSRAPEPRHDVATVVPRLCSYCGLCVTHCPYGARVLDEKERHARVLDHLCQGCGVCVAVCPNGASRQPALEPTRMLAMVDAALAE